MLNNKSLFSAFNSAFSSAFSSALSSVSVRFFVQSKIGSNLLHKGLVATVNR